MTTRRSPLALAVLALLYEQPMHPYRMQQVIRERGKDTVVNVRQRASIYQMIERLQRDGLVRVQETERSVSRPERTVYGLTDEGRATVIEWLRDSLAVPAAEFPELPAALSFIGLLPTSEAVAALRARQQAQSVELAQVEGSLKATRDWLPRLFVIEDDYRRALLKAELKWLAAVIAQFEAGELDVDPAVIAALQQQTFPQEHP